MSESTFAEIVIWQLLAPLAGSDHDYKYRLAYVVNGVCALRYDNEVGKGNHMHKNGQEIAYNFVSKEQLLKDFFAQNPRHGERIMRTVTLSVATVNSVIDSALLAFNGTAQGEHISFASLELLWKVLAPNRMTIVQTLTGSQPLSLREIARRVERDVKAVHSDVQMLLKAGILNKSEDGKIAFEYDAIHVDFMLKAA